MADDVTKPATQIDADGRAVFVLWPKGPPTALPEGPPESLIQVPFPGAPDITLMRNVDEASLTVFPADPVRANGAGVIICPGGGWRILAWQHEGIEVAEWFAERGYAAFLLKYRVRATPADPAEFAMASEAEARLLASPRPAAETPRSLDSLIDDPVTLLAQRVAHEDGCRALALARELAGDFEVDPARIGMIGFSAGAFLVVDVAMDPGGPQPAFIAPIYGGETRGRPVPADAPPLFTAVTQDDRILVSVVRGLVDDWFAADRPVESHLFPRGGHGFGMVRRGLPLERWTELMEAWLRDLGLG